MWKIKICKFIAWFNPFFFSSNVTCLIESRYMSRNKKKKEEEEIIGRERGFN